MRLQNLLLVKRLVCGSCESCDAQVTHACLRTLTLAVLDATLYDIRERCTCSLVRNKPFTLRAQVRSATYVTAARTVEVAAIPKASFGHAQGTLLTHISLNTANAVLSAHGTVSYVNSQALSKRWRKVCKLQVVCA